jgi:hypothetical protein
MDPLPYGSAQRDLDQVTTASLCQDLFNGFDNGQKVQSSPSIALAAHRHILGSDGIGIDADQKSSVD